MKIGIVSPWYERGVAFISLAMRNALAQRHEVFVLARPGINPVGDDFRVPNLRTASPGQYKFPLDWAVKYDLDCLIFNERLDCRNLAPLRKEYGFKTLCLLEWEFVRADEKTRRWVNRCYDAVIAPTTHAHAKYSAMGLRSHHVPWGVDLALFHPPDELRTGPLLFFQPSNFGGMHGRKNVAATQKAWRRADVGDAHLVIHRQREGTMTHAQMAGMYRVADVVLLPSKWEGLGLTFMEALASGCAVVTVDASPMSDYVEDEYNGYVCKAARKGPPPRIFVQQALVALDDYQARIETLAQAPEKAREMGARSREIAEERYDWSVNGKRLVQVVEEVCDG